MQYERYQEIRRHNPEFKSFNDEEITLYINLFDQNSNESFRPHNVYLYSMGSLILVMNWFMFNAGSSDTVDVTVPQNIPMSTIANSALSASGGVITTIFLRLIETKLVEEEPLNKYDIVKTINGMLSACVGITGVSNDVSLGSAYIIGTTSALIYTICSR